MVLCTPLLIPVVCYLPKKQLWHYRLGDTGRSLGTVSFHYYLYGHKVTVITDHTAVRAILDSPNPSGRHAHWWTRVFGQGIREVSIDHRSGRENVAADALSRSQCGESPVEGIGQEEV